MSAGAKIIELHTQADVEQFYAGCVFPLLTARTEGHVRQGGLTLFYIGQDSRLYAQLLDRAVGFLVARAQKVTTDGSVEIPRMDP